MKSIEVLLNDLDEAYYDLGTRTGDPIEACSKWKDAHKEILSRFAELNRRIEVCKYQRPLPSEFSCQGAIYDPPRPVRGRCRCCYVSATSSAICPICGGVIG
jgi:hypothetical protein